MPKWLMRFAFAVMLTQAARVLADPVVPQFSDQTVAAGLSFTHSTTNSAFSVLLYMTPGVGAGDFNRDGYDDLFVSGGQGQNARLFMNNGDGTFTDRALEWGIDLTSAECSSVTIGDIDNDGWLDLYVGVMNGRNYMFHNSGGTAFVDVGASSQAVVRSGGLAFNTYGAAFGDVELDGDLDLVTADWTNPPTHGTRICLNNGAGVFFEAPQGTVDFLIQGIGIEAEPQAFTPALVDMNGDRYPDLPFACDFTNSQYHANNGDGTFTQMPNNGTGTDENGMGSTIGDYDNDGDPDWFVTSIWDDDGQLEGFWGITGNRFYRNEGNHQFTDVTDLTGTRYGHWGWGTSFGDFNNDGLLDLVMTNGMRMPPLNMNPDPTFNSDPSLLFLNTGDFVTGPTFVERSTQAGFIDTNNGKGLVAFDADNDGDLDIVISSNRDPFRFFRNDSNPGPDRWLEIDLKSPPGNAADGIGAKVTLTIGAASYTRFAFANPSFMSSGTHRLHFGFPSTAMIDTIEIAWPDGSVNLLHNVLPGRVIEAMRRGDLNCDGIVTIADTSAFASALVDADAYGSEFVGCNAELADLNADNLLNGDDIALFIADITSP
ncbi:MAG: VCBS repeat-containing protein [Phycisphaerales bacterium]|nr:VCBS repeat-containing protein [Phycisphaerales bacterium]MCB9855679.1 VCBS repeat-containing protein [Phycisphaerales bacterium]MCB9862574.1 VCBS repeat-containing protein [Phycisphaerales bacterium]